MTFSELLLNAADASGFISWIVAQKIAIDHGLIGEFQSDFGAQFAPVDANNFLEWLGY